MAESRSPRFFDPVRDYLESQLRAERFPGAAWWVERRGTVFSSGCIGSAALRPTREPVRFDTPYDLASLTKPFATAWLAIDLDRERRLDLDAPASDYLPDLKRGPYGGVSLVDFGAHRSGLPAWRPLYLAARTLDEYVRAIAETPRAVEAGETLYSDLGYILLGAVIERVTGTPLDSLFEHRIAGPLRLARTGFSRSPGGRFADAAATEAGNRYERERCGELGRNFPWRNEIPRGEVHDGNAHGLGGVAGHAGLFGTLSEVARMCREIVRPRDLPFAGHRREMFLQPVAGAGTRSFGWVLAGDSGASRGILPGTAPGHTGFTGTSAWIEPNDELILVLLTNRVHPVVPAFDFQEVRRGFHQAALRLTQAGPPEAPVSKATS